MKGYLLYCVAHVFFFFFLSGDYRSHLVPLTGSSIVSPSSADNSDSGDDTDDLIEDARNFVMIGRRLVVQAFILEATLVFFVLRVVMHTTESDFAW